MQSLIDPISAKKLATIYAKGTILYREGDRGDTMYLLLSGTVVAYQKYRQKGEAVLASYESGDFFGEMALFLGRKRSATAIAQEEIAVLLIERDNLDQFFQKQPQAAQALVRMLCGRLDFLHPGEDLPANLLHTPRQPLPPAVKKAPPRVAANNKPPAKALALPPELAAIRLPSLQAEALPALFPPGHQNYPLPLHNQDSEHLFNKRYTCPVCGTQFNQLTVKPSKLIPTHTDRDLRVHYLHIEPLYYDMVTCPTCWFSALAEAYKQENYLKRNVLEQALEPYRAGLTLRFEQERDAQTVFASYYLGLKTAALLGREQYLSSGKLWLKLRRLYADCGNQAMRDECAKQALDNYRHVYEQVQISPKLMQQLCYILGELTQTFGDLQAARKFYFEAKTDPLGAPFLKRSAEDRIEELREASAQAKAAFGAS